MTKKITKKQLHNHKQRYILKGGTCGWNPYNGAWEGRNQSGMLDAEFLNFLKNQGDLRATSDGADILAIYKFPSHKEQNTEISLGQAIYNAINSQALQADPREAKISLITYIIRLLDNIVEYRVNDMIKWRFHHTAPNTPSNPTNKAYNHAYILMVMMNLRNAIKKIHILMLRDYVLFPNIAETNPGGVGLKAPAFNTDIFVNIHTYLWDALEHFRREKCHVAIVNGLYYTNLNNMFNIYHNSTYRVVKELFLAEIERHRTIF